MKKVIRLKSDAFALDARPIQPSHSTGGVSNKVEDELVRLHHLIDAVRNADVRRIIILK